MDKNKSSIEEVLVKFIYINIYRMYMKYMIHGGD